MPINTKDDEGLQGLVPGVAQDIECYKFTDGNWEKSSVAVPQEIMLTIFVNSQELVSTLCTPTKLNCLVIGYLFSENVITGMADILTMRVCEEESLADVCLNRTDLALPKRRILTSGCGGGVSLTSIEPKKVLSDLKATPMQILNLMNKLLKEAGLYRISGGVHTSAICDKENILATAEDIGRHNTLDKIQGECLLRKLPTQNKIIVTTGRLSSEMVRKTAGMEIPIVASLTSPTERAIISSKELGITLIGYAKGRRMTIYSCPKRLITMTTEANHFSF